MAREPDFERLRRRMVDRQLRRRGIEDERVLDAMEAVPRERFVPEGARPRAYDDGALPIGRGQTISQPWIVAAICQALGLEGTELVLEVGAGSGYSATVLARLARSVIAIEREPQLVAEARERLTALGVENVELIEGDGSVGLPARGPFDGIAVHATAPGPPRTLLEQLASRGRLVAPVATDAIEMLTLFRRADGDVETIAIAPCRFVPLLGEEGYETDPRGF